MFILTILQISVFKEGQVRLQTWVNFVYYLIYYAKWTPLVHMISFLSFKSVSGSFILQTALYVLHWIEMQRVQSIIAISAVNQLQSFFFFHFLFHVSYLYIAGMFHLLSYRLIHYIIQNHLHCMIFITWWTWFLSHYSSLFLYSFKFMYMLIDFFINFLL